MDEKNSERVITPMPMSLMQAIEDYRFGNRIESRAEAIRRLIQLGLDVARQDASRPAARARKERIEPEGH